MTLNEYQQVTEETAIYPTDHTFEYLCLGLCGEAGETANKVKKVLRGDIALEDQKSAIIEELGDVMWYIAQLSLKLGVPLENVVWTNVNKLAQRKVKNVLKGNGDNR